LSQPQQGDQKFLRKCWVSFTRESKIREICFSLSSTKLGAQGQGQELRCVVNKDLSRRVRPVEGLVLNPGVREEQGTLLRQLIQSWDTKWGLFQGEEGQESNPILETDTPMDLQILYLRLVHSIDFFKGIEYQGEDEMPNRCGLLHVRPASGDEATESELSDYLANFRTKVSKLTTHVEPLSEEESNRIGARNEEQEIERFMESSMQELESDKWLCTLSQKKFKAPEFVRKHISNKFGHKIDEVKMETQFFNNFIKDKEKPEPPKPAPQVVKRPTAPPPPEDLKRKAPDSDDKMEMDQPPPKRSVKERLGNGGVRITYNTQDPRNIIDYSDVDSFAFDFDY